MSVIYLISIFILLTLVVLVKKSDKKLDILKTITIIMVLFLGYQTFISYICTMLHIPITLLSLTLINLALIAILATKILHKKEIQVYEFNVKDAYYIIILIFVVFIISYLNFEMPISIKYLSTDSAIHYMSAREFYENESLLLTAENINSSNAMMPGAYSNIGILFKAFEPFIGEMNLYKVFIGFDIFTFFLSGMLFFVTIKKYAKNNLTYFLAGVVSIIYLLGYPLNNMLFGYFYLGIGVLVINAIVAIMQDLNEIYEISMLKIGTALFLLCFELFFSYYLFVPPVYAAIFIYFLFYFHKKKGKWINKEFTLSTIFILIIPAIMGFCYHVLPGILSADQIQVGNIIQLEGYIYRNLYSNIILFISFAIYYLIREKKLQFDIICIVIWIMYMSVLYLSIFELNISTYYFFKTYFVLWQLIIYLFFKGICYITEDKIYGKILSAIYISIYIVLMVIFFIVSDVKVIKDTFNKDEKITDAMDIYGINKTVLFKTGVDYTEKEMEILNYIKENNIKLENDNTLIIANQRQEYWFWALLDYRFKSDLNFETTNEHIESWNNGTYEYLIYFTYSDYYDVYKDDIDLEGREIIFQNENGAIIKNK